jgi:hypothetical protein
MTDTTTAVGTDAGTRESDAAARIRAARRRQRLVLVATFATFAVVLAVVLALTGAFDGDSTEPRARTDDDLGATFSIPATAAHPALRAGVDEIGWTKSAVPGLHVAHGHHLMAVRVTLGNEGATSWRGTVAGATYVDDRGRAFHADPRFTAVTRGEVWPARFQIAAGRTQAAYVVFDLPANAEPASFSLAVGPVATDRVTWRLPRTVVGPALG